MFFVRLAQVVAWVALILGIMRVVMGFVVASNPEMQARYLGRHTSGEAIDQGIESIVIAIAIGVLAQIGLSVTKLAARSE